MARQRPAAPAAAARDRLLVSFAGFTLSPAEAEAIARRAAGVTLYRHLNVRSARQVRELAETLQAAAARLGLPPLVIGIDHETGQLHALGDDATPFAGAMAIGATDDEALAERVGRAIGTELRAVGVNLVYAPVCDLATNPANPVVGIRSFGDEPAAVGRLAAATMRGLQSAGVAATVKHLPGHGEPGADSHLGLPLIERTAEELRARELVPFRTAIAAGARIAMAGHLAVPALTGRRDLPATLARAIVTDLLRTELGFDGIVVSDALDMGGVRGDGAGPDVAAALRAGIDLLLCGPDGDAQARVEAGLARAFGGREPADARAFARRLAVLRGWLGSGEAVDVDVVGCDAHRALADELARRSITRIRDRDGLLGRRLPDDARVLVVEPRPRNITPADTTALLAAGSLAAAIAARGVRVEGHVVDEPFPSPTQVGLPARALDADLIVIGTAGERDGSRLHELARSLPSTSRPVIGVCLRGPWDADAYPAIGTVLAGYGSQPPTLAALAAAIVEGAEVSGRLPVRVATAG